MLIRFSAFTSPGLRCPICSSRCSSIVKIIRRLPASRIGNSTFVRSTEPTPSSKNSCALSRQIIILDTCAKIEEDFVISTESGLLSENYNLIKGHVNFRENYEKAILSMPEQEVILYSSSIDEYSRDDTELGGYFAYNLLVSAKQNTKNVLSCKEAYSYAKDIVQKKTHNKQNPQGEFIKTSNILPFSLGEIK